MRKFFIAISVFVALISCSEKQQDSEVSEKKTKESDFKADGFKMYEMSQMATLMERMAKEHEEVREKILKGDSLGSIPMDYYDIYTASFTDSADNDATFKSWAKLYIAAEESLYSASENKIVAFNAAVDVCYQCHTQKCGGPIPRIKKLYIKE